MTQGGILSSLLIKQVLELSLVSQIRLMLVFQLDFSVLDLGLDIHDLVESVEHISKGCVL